MAITQALLTSGTDTNAGTSTTTASVSPTADALVVIAVTTDDANSAPSSITSSGLTWVKIDEVLGFDGDARVLSVWRAMGSSPGSGAITINWGSGVTEAGWVVNEFYDVDTSGSNGSGAVGGEDGTNVAQNESMSTPSTFTVTLAAFDSTDNGVYGASADSTPDEMSAGSGFTLIDAVTAGSAVAVGAEWRNDNDTSVDFSYPGGGDECAGIAFEVNAGTAVAIEQEGFAFGDDDGNEASHTLATQDTDQSYDAETTQTLRMLLNMTGDAAATAFKLQYKLDSDPAAEWEDLA